MNGWAMPISDLAEHAAGCLWRATWQGGFGFLVAWVICRLAPRMPARFQCWIWRLALLKFLVVLFWGVPIALPLLPRAAERMAELRTPIPTASVIGSESPVPSAMDARVRRAAGVWPLLLTGLLVGWLAGVAWQGGRLVRGWLAVRQFRRSCRPIGRDDLGQDLRILCRAYAIRREPPLLECDGDGSPLLIGLLRPAIVLPSGLLSALTVVPRRMMLAHELAHIRRRDLAWGLVAAVVRAVFFFHPFAWWGSRRLEVAQEIAADQLVLATFPEETGIYAEMLLSVASQPLHSGMIPALSAGTVGSYEALRARLASMKGFRITPRRVVVVSAILVGLIAIAGVVPWRLVAAGYDDPTIIKSLIPEAAGIPKTDWDALTRSERPLQSKDIRSYSLTMWLLTLRAPQPKMRSSKDFHVLKSQLPVREVREALMKDSSPGYASLIHTDEIADFTCAILGDSATGTVSFRAEGLWEGKAEYTAKREKGKWRIDEFGLPDYEIRVERGQNGMWTQSPFKN